MELYLIMLLPVKLLLLDFFSEIDTENMHLLSFSCSSYSNIRKWKGKISFFNWMVDGEFI